MVARLASLAAGCLLGILTPSHAQEPVAPDSAKNLRGARAVQRSFESSRHTAAIGGSVPQGPCEQRVGSFCYWYDEYESMPTIEPTVVTERRDRLLSELAAAASRHPGDGWVTGQRVRYLVEANRLAEAIDIARGCQSAPWWCAALEGFALHTAERFPDGEAAFHRALALMPAAQACAWLDIEPLLEDREGGAFKKLSCAVRPAAVDSLLWLGRPAYSRRGNDLYTEVLARRTMIAMLSDARTPHGSTWGKDAATLLFRYGWEVAWRTQGPSYGGAEAQVVGYERKPAYPFIPVTRTEGGRSRWEWDLRRLRPQMRYSPTYSTGFSPIPEYQLARFPRGDSMVVVVGFSLADDTLFQGAPLDASLALAGDRHQMPAVGRTTLPGPSGAVLTTGRITDWIVSIEAEGRGARRYVLARAILDPLPRGAVTVSDPLLMTAGAIEPRSLVEAAARALPSNRVSRGTPAGVYWEITGATGDSLSVTLAIVPDKRGLLGRITEGLALAKRPVPLAVTYRAATTGAGTVGRSIEIDFRTVKPGRYRLRLELSSANGMVRTVDRPLIVE